MFHPVLNALIGGALVGTAASILLVALGRVCGISGIFGSALTQWSPEHRWRFAFIAGLFVGGVILVGMNPDFIRPPSRRPEWVVAVAGVLVGFGTRLGNGCTSGHGVCGLARFSQRSLVATVVFMITGFLAATGFAWFGSAP